MASLRDDLKRLCVICGEPRHRVDNRLMTVETEDGVFVSGVAVDMAGDCMATPVDVR